MIEEVIQLFCFLRQLGADAFKLVGGVLVSACVCKARAFDRYLSDSLCNSVGHGKLREYH